MGYQEFQQNGGVGGALYNNWNWIGPLVGAGFGALAMHEIPRRLDAYEDKKAERIAFKMLPIQAMSQAGQLQMGPQGPVAVPYQMGFKHPGQGDVELAGIYNTLGQINTTLTKVGDSVQGIDKRLTAVETDLANVKTSYKEKQN